MMSSFKGFKTMELSKAVTMEEKLKLDSSIKSELFKRESSFMATEYQYLENFILNSPLWKYVSWWSLWAKSTLLIL
ncbi:hypothetical protein WICPIJ_000360 [Wickerhamomyces pijperi]|uniref:Uncharacterized protein n=1 Tax=Wickerhamomyces pijperi TaxID=599730 RepID=A0A9P8TS55_WICPI|nr:hypothetical protein WICPIJ_000360 [Wickerhamomyces pijperi]